MHGSLKWSQCSHWIQIRLRISSCKLHLFQKKNFLKYNVRRHSVAMNRTVDIWVLKSFWHRAVAFIYFFSSIFGWRKIKRTLLLHKMLGSIAMGLLVPCYVALRIHTHMQTQTSVTFIFFTLNRRQYVVLLSAQPICFRCRRLKSYTKISPGKKCCFFFHNSD